MLSMIQRLRLSDLKILFENVVSVGILFNAESRTNPSNVTNVKNDFFGKILGSGRKNCVGLHVFLDFR